MDENSDLFVECICLYLFSPGHGKYAHDGSAATYGGNGAAPTQVREIKQKKGGEI